MSETKPMKITLTDAEGNCYFWRVNRVPRAFNCNSPTIGESRVISGWEYTDHEGYTRFSERNWFNLVAHLRGRADCYGLTANISWFPAPASLRDP